MTIPRISITNYTLIAENKKAETRVEVEKVPAVMEAILTVLREDKAWWAANGQKQLGIERNTLLQKVCNKVPINSNVFEIALDVLSGEQSVVSFAEGNLTRYILLEINNVT